MAESEMELLLDRCTENAQIMRDRAREGVKSLTRLEQAVQTAQTRLDQDISESRNQLLETVKLLAHTEEQVTANQAVVLQMLQQLEAQSASLETQVAQETDRLLAESQALADRGDAALVALQKALADCRHNADVMRTQAHNELTTLTSESKALNGALTQLVSHCEAVEKQLHGAVGQVLHSHANLDAALQRSLDDLLQAYTSTMTTSQKQLTELDTQMGQWLKSVDGNLDETLVANLGKGLRKAADGLAGNLTELEKMLTSLAASVVSAQDDIQKNLDKCIVPAVDQTSQSLRQAAAACGLLS